MYREAAATKAKVLGKDHPDLARTLNNEAELQQDMGECRDAVPLYSEALRIYRKALGNASNETALVVARLAGALACDGRPDQAVSLAREGARSLEDQLPVDNADRAEGESILGYCLAKLRQYPEAEPILLNSYKVLLSKEPGRLRTRRAGGAILGLYEAWGKPEKAKEWRARLEPANTATAQVKK